jgi:hypothetical protein
MTKNTPQALPDKEALWAIYIKKNPQWVSDGAHLTPEGLKKFVEQVWLHGYNHATSNSKVTIT